MLPRRLLLLLSLARPAPAAADTVPPPAPIAARRLNPVGAPPADCRPVTTLRSVGPFVEATVCGQPEHSPAPGGENTEYLLYLRTARGWSAARLGTSGTLCGGKSLFPVYFDQPTLAASDAAPGGALVVRYRAGADHIRQSELMICALAPSGAPACAGPMVPERDGQWSATATVERGAVVLDYGARSKQRVPLVFR
jgi:hypothetical protein